MTEVERIADQLRRAYEGEAWHGPSLREVLEGITAERAARRPLKGAHSIQEIVKHILAGEEIVRRRLERDPGMARPTTEEDWWPPATETGEAAWAALLEELALANSRLRRAISLLDDSRLDEPIVEGMSSVYVTLHGLIQHDLYHAGQIALLKKD